MESGERARLRESFQEVLRQRAMDMNDKISATIHGLEQELDRALTVQNFEPEPLREISRNHRLIQQVFAINAAGKRIFPSTIPAQQSTEEQSFLARSEVFWKSGDRLDAAANDQGSKPAHGWHVWYHGTGQRFLYWKRHPSGGLIGAEVPPAVILSEVIGHLPDGIDENSAFELSDATGKSLYVWGQVIENPLSAKHPVSAPLGAWFLTCSMRDAVAVAAKKWNANFLLGLGTAASVLGLIAYYLYRESSREARLAGQRVSFVNQVSHELKTPLTNISLYAELATQRLPEDATHARECLDVVTTESARLGRLIGNVLTFSKHQRGTLQPKLGTCDLTATIRSVVDQFRPALESKHLQIELRLGELKFIQTDADMLGQILGNLLSNVEKYASDGGRVDVTAEQDAAATRITVRDFGPGIPAGMHTRIFEPFVRVSDRLSDGSTGTGIGLGIARDLARILGGNLISQSPAEGPGAYFILTLLPT